jgi:hypothetical protein
MFFNDTGGGRGGRHFLHIDNLDSLTTAATLSGNGSAALKCWIAITHRARVAGTREVQLTTALCRQFGILTRKAKESGLRHWEILGVFKARRQSGKNPRVTILANLDACRRRAKLTRNQVEHMGGEFGNLANFNEGEDYAARATGETDRKRLEQASKSGEPLDLELADYGSGWIIEKIKPASEEWQKAHIEISEAAAPINPTRRALAK